MSAIDKAPDPRDYVPSSQPTMPAQRFIAKPGAAIEQAPKADTGSSGAAAALESAAGGLVETAPVVPLALAGAKAGAAALSGVAPPYGAAVGATVGGIGGAALGMYAGSEAREALDLRRPADFPEADRPDPGRHELPGRRRRRKYLMLTPRLRASRFASPLAGGDTCGPAKPVPRCSLIRPRMFWAQAATRRPRSA